MAQRTDFTVKKVNNFMLNDDDRLVLSLLYRPLIGSRALDIYNVLYELVKDSVSFSGPVVILIDMLSEETLTDDDLNNGIKVLKKFKLLKVDTQTSFVLYPPYDKQSFKNSILFKYLLDNISSIQYDYLSDRFNWEKAKDSGLSIPDVSLLDIPFATRKPAKAPFEFKLFKDHAALSGTIIKDEDRLFFESLAATYSLSLDDALVVLIESSDDEGNYTRDGIIDAAHNKFEIKKKKVETKNKHISKGDEEYIEYFKNTSPEDVLKTSNGLSEADLSIIDRLRKNFDMPDELISILLVYSLATKDKTIRPYQFFDKIARDWGNKHIETAEDAFYYITDLYNKDNKKEKKPVSTESWINEYYENLRKQMEGWYGI